MYVFTVSYLKISRLGTVCPEPPSSQRGLTEATSGPGALEPGPRIPNVRVSAEVAGASTGPHDQSLHPKPGGKRALLSFNHLAGSYRSLRSEDKIILTQSRGRKRAFQL